MELFVSFVLFFFVCFWGEGKMSKEYCNIEN